MAAQLTENQRTWIAELRSGARNQTKSVLKRVGADGEVSFCCLGVAAELSDTCVQRRDEYDERVGFLPANRITDQLGNEVSPYETLPPGEVLVWLGIAHEARVASSDITVDVPDEMRHLREQGTEDLCMRYYRDLDPDDDDRATLTYLSAASMNDDGFTFDQIADVFEYFGLKTLRY